MCLQTSFCFQAANRDTQMYWLQQLQLKRALFREKHAEHQSMPRPDNLTVESTPSANCPGKRKTIRNLAFLI